MSSKIFTAAEVAALEPEWSLYQKLVANVPEDIGVKDVCVGSHWIFIEAESGCGVALNAPGGVGAFEPDDVRGLALRDLAAQCVSWNFLQASIGVAALNAWYSTPENATAAGMVIEKKASNDAFDFYHQLCAGKKVTVVGHFPMIERLSDVCELTILERNPSEGDVPDPGCEYLIPHQDVTFMTGLTFTNKTMPRLLQLSQNGSTVLVGPSVIPSPIMFGYGVNCMAGSVVTDPERAREAITGGSTAGIFKSGVQKMRVEQPGWTL